MSDYLRDRLAAAVRPFVDKGATWSKEQQAADAVLAVVQPELDKFVALFERGHEQHMRFGLAHPDGSTEMLPCADWCYACKLEQAEAERDAALATLARVRELAEQWERETDGGLAGALIFPSIAARLYRALAGPAGAGSTQDGA